MWLPLGDIGHCSNKSFLEHRDQPFGIVADVANILGGVLEVHTLNSDVIAFTNGSWTTDGAARAAAKTPDWEKQLAAWNVTVDNRTITSFQRIQDGGQYRDNATGMQYDKFLLHFTEGEPVERNAFLVEYPTDQTSTLPAQMGLEMDSNKIKVTSAMRTNETGVFAVGDANSDGSTNVPHAMFSGKRAAVYAHG